MIAIIALAISISAPELDDCDWRPDKCAQIAKGRPYYDKIKRFLESVDRDDKRAFSAQTAKSAVLVQTLSYCPERSVTRALAFAELRKLVSGAAVEVTVDEGTWSRADHGVGLIVKHAGSGSLLRLGVSWRSGVIDRIDMFPDDSAARPCFPPPPITITPIPSNGTTHG